MPKGVAPASRMASKMAGMSAKDACTSQPSSPAKLTRASIAGRPATVAC